MFNAQVNNKGADQPPQLHNKISLLVVHAIDSVVYLISISKTSKTGFLMKMLK